MRRWWQGRTLRFRLALWYAVVGTLLLAVFSATIYFYVSERMALPLDHELRQDLVEVRARLKVQPDGRITWDGHEVKQSALLNWTDPWLELWDEEGNLVCRLWPLEDARLERLPVAPAQGHQTISVFDVTPDIPLRELSVPFDGPEGKPGWMLRVIRIHKSADDALSALLIIIVIALPIVIALLVLGGYSVTRRWLKPLDDMVEEANHITTEDFNRRLPVKNPHDELGRLAVVFNVTLDRLENSFVALDHFVADASHELRTPLTTLRSVGEVGLKRSRTVEEYRDIIASMLEEAQRLQFLVQRLLVLAKAEGGPDKVEQSLVRLDKIVVACAGELGVLAEDKQQRIVLDTVECAVVTDPVIFRQALENLIDNAIKYSPVGAKITVALERVEKTCSVTVTDEGPGIGPEHQPHVTGRFFRTGRPRGRTAGGFGLGLALTNAYMRMLGGTLQFKPVEPHGSSFSLTLPAA
jgi:two-component system OmpR family sensor kinase